MVLRNCSWTSWVMLLAMVASLVLGLAFLTSVANYTKHDWDVKRALGMRSKALLRAAKNGAGADGQPVKTAGQSAESPAGARARTRRRTSSGPSAAATAFRSGLRQVPVSSTRMTWDASAMEPR